jgi:hypothetical protein
VADEVGTGELARRLDEIRGILQGLVGRPEYTEYQRLIEHRFTDLERDLLQEIADRKAGDQELKDRHDKQGTNWRQAIYAGLIPGVLFLITVLLQLKGGGV